MFIKEPPHETYKTLAAGVFIKFVVSWFKLSNLLHQQVLKKFLFLQFRGKKPPMGKVAQSFVSC